jgi:tRNA 2-selenouridine synthase
MFNIRKRLGMQRYQALVDAQRYAVNIMQNTGSLEHHRDWLVPLLEQYYDPMYTYQLGKKAERILFRGDYQQVKEWLASR